MLELLKKADSFKALDHWFSAFSRRYGVALRRKTHTAQKAPEQLRPAITNKIPCKNLAQENMGKYEDCDIVHMDQTPLSFILDGGKSGDATAWEKEVWFC